MNTQVFFIDAECAALRELYGEIDALLARPADEVRVVRADVSGWNAEQHLAHVSLANELVVRNLRSLLKGAGPFVVEVGELPQAALDVLASGKFPRGAAQAPRIVRPPDEVVREYLVEWLADNRRDFSALAAQARELEATTKKVPHQILGPLTAAQWMRFAAAHTRHHLEIVREIVSA